MLGLDCDLPSMHLFDRRHSPRAVDGSPTWRVQPGMEVSVVRLFVRAFLPGTHSTARNDSAKAVDSFCAARQCRRARTSRVHSEPAKPNALLEQIWNASLRLALPASP